MAIEKKTQSEPKRANPAGGSNEHTQSEGLYKALTFWQNVVMTIKVLAVVSALVLLIWLVDRGVS